jgi:hypothetical protein
VAEHFEPDILPTLKYATQKIYSLLLRKHLLPRRLTGIRSATRMEHCYTSKERLCVWHKLS